MPVSMLVILVVFSNNSTGSLMTRPCAKASTYALLAASRLACGVSRSVTFFAEMMFAAKSPDASRLTILFGSSLDVTVLASFASVTLPSFILAVVTALVAILFVSTCPAETAPAVALSTPFMPVGNCTEPVTTRFLMVLSVKEPDVCSETTALLTAAAIIWAMAGYGLVAPVIDAGNGRGARVCASVDWSDFFNSAGSSASWYG